MLACSVVALGDGVWMNSRDLHPLFGFVSTRRAVLAWRQFPFLARRATFNHGKASDHSHKSERPLLKCRDLFRTSRRAV